MASRHIFQRSLYVLWRTRGAISVNGRSLSSIKTKSNTDTQVPSMAPYKFASRYDGTDKNVWVQFTKLAVDTGSLNLGQGFPDFLPPSHVSGAVATVGNSDHFGVHQYTRAFGHPRLVKALAKLFTPLLKQTIDPMTNILVSAGAYGSLYYSMMGLVNPGDEVIIIEPYFDCYEPMVRVAGGTPVFVPLRPSKSGVEMSSADWKLDPSELESKFSKKTKLLVLNTPNNPLGKVFSREELQMIADLCIKYDIICVADEVFSRDELQMIADLCIKYDIICVYPFQVNPARSRTESHASLFIPRTSKLFPVFSRDELQMIADLCIKYDIICVYPFQVNPARSRTESHASSFIPRTSKLFPVFSREELQMIADLCIKYDIICVADEVYEWLVYPGKEHIKIASLPNMWERTITIGSVGKTFNVTGWKLGWSVAPEGLIKCLTVAHQNCVYTCSTPLQEATAIGLEHEMEHLGTDSSYFVQVPKMLQPKREYLAQSLKQVGMPAVIPDGGYFMMADISQIKADIPDDGSGDPYDFRFVRWMAKEKKLCGIPPSAFYSAEHKHLGENYIRFCFIKEDSTLEKADKILTQWSRQLKS